MLLGVGVCLDRVIMGGYVGGNGIGRLGVRGGLGVRLEFEGEHIARRCLGQDDLMVMDGGRMDSTEGLA